jgi:hypothetical protein
MQQMTVTGRAAPRTGSRRWVGRVAVAAVAVVALGACRQPARTPPTGDDPAAVPSGGTVTVTSTIRLTGAFDGGGRRYRGAGALGGDGDGEGKEPIFQLADGVTLSNVVIGVPAADGVHCLGSCTLRNIVWEDVQDDAATFKGTAADQTMVVDGGRARKASDKVFQHNGPGTMIIRDFEVEDFGKLYRSCGNCSRQYARHVRIENVTATAPGATLAGINANYGDTASFSNITIRNDPGHRIDICQRYTGNSVGAEPGKVGSGSGAGCSYTTANITYR